MSWPYIALYVYCAGMVLASLFVAALCIAARRGDEQSAYLEGKHRRRTPSEDGT